MVPNAYAAARRAVADTATVAVSGTIVTHLTATWLDQRGPLALESTVQWNGDDLSVEFQHGEDGGYGSLFVDGRYYEKHDGAWVHYSANGAGHADPSVSPSWVDDPSDGLVWLNAARRDISGERVGGIIDVLQDLVQTPQGDGSVVYIGHATAEAIAGQFRDADGLPYASRPFTKLGDPQTSVKVMVTVGADGIIRSLACGYSWDNADWLYTAAYESLGSTPAIPTPDPATVIESDGTRG